MIYVMSDVHGEYDKFRSMLEKIAFSSADTLFVLGDVIDRGPHPVKLLQDMAARDNVYPILGNHEAVAIDILDRLMVEITEENYATQVDAGLLSHMLDWQEDGGMTTLREFQKLPVEERYDLLDYLSDFALYETVDAGGRSFVLCHAGLGNFSPDRALGDYLPHELVFGRRDYSQRYFEDPSIYVVTGHTPTLAVTGRPEILVSSNNILIDCGATYPGGRLACLCLDTMEEYYV